MINQKHGNFNQFDNLKRFKLQSNAGNIKLFKKKQTNIDYKHKLLQNSKRKLN